ncbi:SDR family NAD(P)-dependent oxidoreductase [Heliomicrobium undosum]|nr:SDR family NAD(P)-dependent oxidoreductase [Heliomicrobium undosum]
MEVNLIESYFCNFRSKHLPYSRQKLPYHHCITFDERSQWNINNLTNQLMVMPLNQAAAIQLAKIGMHVLIGCRHEERGLAALREIREGSNSHDVDLLVVDMSSQRSIKAAVATFKSTYDRLDVLIHNAADFDISRKRPVFSEENIETVWATNHIGPVLLTDLNSLR